MMEYTESDIRKAIEADGKSMSKVARELGKHVAQISNFCKRNNIKSKYSSNEKILPLEEIKLKYEDGISMYKLSKEYKRPAAIIKKKLLSKFPEMPIRDMNEAKRPPELNDSDTLFELMNEYSLTKIAGLLEVKVSTVCDAVKRLNLTDYVRRQDISCTDDELRYLYEDQKLSSSAIARAFNTYPTTIIRNLRRIGVEVRPPGGVERDSKYAEFNDPNWLREIYLEQGKSTNFIAAIVRCRPGMVKYYLEKYNIPMRPKKEVYRKLRRRQATKSAITTKWGEFKLASLQERNFINMLSSHHKEVLYEPDTFSCNGSDYTPDFRVDGDYVEVKPPDYAIKPGINRQRFIKQYIVALNNNIEVKTWYKGKYFSIDPIEDIDRYFCLNWKLVFETDECLYKFLTEFGFHPLEYEKDKLLMALNKIEVPSKDQLNAVRQNQHVVDFMKHFNPHFWSSYYKNHLPMSAAFQLGNSIVLRKSVEKIWTKNNNCNIYGLINIISREFKDFRGVSLFKPWIARFIYNKYLPNGGVVVDPCMGWGGRLLGTIDLDIKYIGYDLNPLCRKAHESMSEFVGSRFINKPAFHISDSSKVTFENCDMIFTSPPYDDTEYYHGLDSQCNDTNPIYDNIFKSKATIIALNVPIRHQRRCIKISKKHGWELAEIEKIKTRTMFRHNETYEPILAFKK